MFSRRFRIFTLFGFQVWIDASWLLVAALIAWTLAAGVFPQTLPGLEAPSYWWMAVVATIGLLGSIVFHETSHALVARRYGIEIRGITLFVFGGVAQMAAEPESARAEFLMALAGPVASGVLSGIFFVLYGLVGSFAGPRTLVTVLWYLGLLNSMLAIFNLVPAFPLDGGRMLRAALWGWRKDIGWATRIAASLGDSFGILLIVFGVIGVLRGNVIGGVWQVLIGMFLRVAAGAGYRQTMAQRLLADISVSEVMTPDPIAVSPDLPVSRFVEEYLYRYHHREFPVTRDDMLLGNVGTKQVAALDRRRWPLTPVAAIAVACAPADTIAPQAAAVDAIQQMANAGRSRLMVVRDGRLLGILSHRDLVELVSIKLELINKRGRPPAPRQGSSLERASESAREGGE